MLVLSRKPGEKIQIGGGITVTVLELTQNRVRIGIDAPQDVRILREELVGAENQKYVNFAASTEMELATAW